jgi:hypothetical protein
MFSLKPVSETAPDPGRCPLCGAANGCAMQAAPGLPPGGQPLSCWCRAASIGPDVLERIPTALRGQACICARCAKGQG